MHDYLQCILRLEYLTLICQFISLILTELIITNNYNTLYRFYLFVEKITTKYYADLVPNSKFVVIKDAAHMTMQDNPKQDIKEITEFINEIEK